MVEHGGNTQLFAVFILSIAFLVMLIITIYKLCSGTSAEEEVVKPWLAKQKQQASIFAVLGKYLTPGNILLLLGWALVLVLAWYVSSTAGPLKSFDPFEILGVPETATEREIKKAYRKLSLQYHPDKNPDPAAHDFFANFIQKAYQALTDEVSRENYRKYGHPDGRQAMSMGIALPEWVFAKDQNRAPWLLAGLVVNLGMAVQVGLGVLLPLALAACFLLRAEDLAGADQLDQLTMSMFVQSKWNIKESGGLSRIPETLVMAKPFVLAPFLPEHQVAMEELRRIVLRLQPDLKEKSLFWKRRPSIVKAHMLLIAYMAREPIPTALDKDLKLVLQRSPFYLQEMSKIAAYPRPPIGLGWLTPALASIEYLQCLVQAVQPSIRKPIMQNVGKGSTDGVAALMQLPHFDQELLRKLSRKKVKALSDLTEMKARDRQAAFIGCALTQEQIDDIECALSALPSVTITSVKLVVDGVEAQDESIIMENDIVTCNVRVLLSRASHTALLEKTVIKGKATLAYALQYPFPKEEQWYFGVGDPATNALLSIPLHGPNVMLEAERAGASKAAQLVQMVVRMLSVFMGQAGHGYVSPQHSMENGSQQSTTAVPAGDKEKDSEEAVDQVGAYAYQEGDCPEEGQLIQIRFRAPKAGKRLLMLYILCDSWIGSDRAIPLRLKVAEQTRAEQEGRTFRGKATPADAAEDAPPAADDEDKDAADDKEEDEEDEDYDSEEGETEESGSDSEDEEGEESTKEQGSKEGSDKDAETEEE